MTYEDDFEITDGLAEHRERYGIEWFDHVRIRVAPATEPLGYAGLEGDVFGETAPSESKVGPIIGTSEADFALYVHFEERDEGAWFAPELVEFLDRPVGAELEIAGVTMVRDEQGNWQKIGRAGRFRSLLNRLRRAAPGAC